MLAGTARRIRFGTVLAVVVLSLTGFSTHGGSSGNSGGGGCSSSKSSGDGKSGSKTSGKTTGKTTGKKSYGGGTDATPAASASPTGPPATTTLISCGDVTQPSTTIEVTSLLDRAATFEVSMYREEAGGAVIETATGRITLKARGTGTTVIAMKNPARAGAVAACRISSVHVVADPSATPGPTPTSVSGPVKPGSKPTPKPTRKVTGKTDATTRP